jgi:hypothetical protein
MRDLTKAAFVIGKDHRRQITARIKCSSIFSLIPVRASIAATYLISPSPRNNLRVPPGGN